MKLINVTSTFVGKQRTETCAFLIQLNTQELSLHTYGIQIFFFGVTLKLGAIYILRKDKGVGGWYS